MLLTLLRSNACADGNFAADLRGMAPGCKASAGLLRRKAGNDLWRGSWPSLRAPPSCSMLGPPPCGMRLVRPARRGRPKAPIRRSPRRARRLFPRINIARAIGWPEGAMPKPAEGLRSMPSPKVSTIRAGSMSCRTAMFSSPRPTRPRARRRGGFKGMVDGQGYEPRRRRRAEPQPHRAVARRRRRWRGRDETRVPRRPQLAVRHGARRGQALCGRNRRAAPLRLPRGRDRDRAAPGTKIADLPGWPANHHWTKSLAASPDGSRLYVGVGSNSNVGENGLDAGEGPRADPRNRSGARARRAASPPD